MFIPVSAERRICDVNTTSRDSPLVHSAPSTLSGPIPWLRHSTMVSSSAYRFKQMNLFLSRTDFYIHDHSRLISGIFVETKIELAIPQVLFIFFFFFFKNVRNTLRCTKRILEEDSQRRILSKSGVI